MKICGNNALADGLIKGDDRVVYNLITLIRECPDARIFTDGRSYLTAQSNAQSPIWIYINSNADGKSEEQIFNILCDALKENGGLRINADEKFYGVLSRFSKMGGAEFSKRGTLCAYSAENVTIPTTKGTIIQADERFLKEIAKLNIVACADDNGEDLSNEQAMAWAKKYSASGNVYLWKDKDIVSMARVVEYAEFARLTSVVTKRSERGKGYAKMIVGELAASAIEKGLTPVLYTRAENPSSNRCYLGIGFKKRGEICEFSCYRKNIE